MVFEKKKTAVFLILICTLQLLMSLFWAEKKSYLFMDELFSYVTSNRVEGIDTEFPSNEWLDSEWFTEYVSAAEEHRFEYGIPYRNQEKDVHPPLFYLFLHTACSIIPGEFSYWTGTGCNILFFVASTIVLYLLTREIFKSQTCGLIVAFLYSISYGGLNTMVFIRMYMLLTLIVLLHAYVYMRYFEKEEIENKGYFFLGITVILGMLTQYYFMIIAFFFGTWYFLRFLYKKQFVQLGKYLLTALGSAGCCLLLYPTMLKHLLSTSRGMEARENFVNSAGYGEKLRAMWRLMDSQLFSNLFLIIFVLLLVIMVILCYNFKKNVTLGCMRQIGVLVFSCAGYFFLVTKIAPYQVDRYLMPMYPIIYMVVIGVFYQVLEKLVPIRAAIIMSVVLFGGLSAVHLFHSDIPYTYSEDIVITPRLDIAEEYEECYAIYIAEREEDIPKYYDIMQVLSMHKGYYYIDDTARMNEIKEDMGRLANEKKVVVYVDNKIKSEKIKEDIQTYLMSSNLSEIKLLYEDEKWELYLIENNEI